MNKYILLIVLTLVLFSCRKERGLYDCSDNCKTYEIKGRIFDPISNKAFANYPVKLRWVTFRGNCIFCPRKQRDIYNGKTDRNGNFSVVVNLDTTLFQDYSVVFSTPEKEHYRNVYHGYLEDENLRGKPIEVPFYPQAILTVQLMRTQNDTFERVSVSHSWTRIEGNRDILFLQDFYRPMSGKQDTTIHIKTVTDLLTTVRVSKYLNGRTQDVHDSIVCEAGKDNVLRFEY